MIDLAPLVGLGLLLVRPGAMILASPPFGGSYAPTHVKIGLTVLLAIALLPQVAVPPAGSTVSLALVVAREVAIGLALGLAIRAVVASVELAGQLTGFQMGLSYSAIIDPQSGVRNSLVGILYVNVALVTFLLVNGHHAILRALHASYDSLPIGSGGIGSGLPGTVMAMLGLVFMLGTRLAAPIVLVLVVCEVSLSLAARAAPMLNVMAVDFPLRLLVGLVVLGLLIPAVSGVASDATTAVIRLGVEGANAFR